MASTDQSKRRSLFCCYYAQLGDVVEAAWRAGYPAKTTAADGAALLRKSVYRNMTNSYRLALQDNAAALVRTGLERLAFGRSNDAVRLLLVETPPTVQELETLDLFAVSSIKRDKSGGIEVHFFDRLKALAALYEYNGDADGMAAAHALLAALSRDPEKGGE